MAGESPTVRKHLRDRHSALAAPDLREKFANAGLVPVGGSIEQFDALVRSETVRWGRVIRTRGIKAD